MWLWDRVSRDKRIYIECQVTRNGQKKNNENERKKIKDDRKAGKV